MDVLFQAAMRLSLGLEESLSYREKTIPRRNSSMDNS
jgi:hypothetical protein